MFHASKKGSKPASFLLQMQSTPSFRRRSAVMQHPRATFFLRSLRLPHSRCSTCVRTCYVAPEPAWPPVLGDGLVAFASNPSLHFMRPVCFNTLAKHTPLLRSLALVALSMAGMPHARMPVLDTPCEESSFIDVLYVMLPRPCEMGGQPYGLPMALAAA